jgi:hypothetical protein
MADEGKSNVGLTKSFFWIVVVALTVMIVIAVGLWGCQRWKHNEGHDQPQTRNIPSNFFAPGLHKA